MKLNPGWIHFSTPQDMSIVDKYKDLEESSSEQQVELIERNEEIEVSKAKDTKGHDVRVSTLRKNVTKSHRKRSTACSKIQVISQLASELNRLLDISAKKIRTEERYHKSIIKYRREEQEKTVIIKWK